MKGRPGHKGPNVLRGKAIVRTRARKVKRKMNATHGAQAVRARAELQTAREKVEAMKTRQGLTPAAEARIAELEKRIEEIDAKLIPYVGGRIENMPAKPGPRFYDIISVYPEVE